MELYTVGVVIAVIVGFGIGLMIDVIQCNLSFNMKIIDSYVIENK